MVRDVDGANLEAVYTRKVKNTAYGTEEIHTTTGTGLSLRRGRYDLRASDGHRPTLYGGWNIRAKPLQMGMFGSKPTQKWERINGVTRVTNGEIQTSHTGTLAFPNIILSSLRVDLSQTALAHYAPLPNGLLQGKLENKLRSKLIDKQLDVGVAIAEIRENLDLMASGLTNLLSIWEMVRKRKWAALKRHLRMKYSLRNKRGRTTFAENWLAYKLGWEPIISDIYSAHEAINSILRKDPLLRVEARVWDNLLSKSRNPLGGFTGYEFPVGKYYQSYYGSITARIEDDALNSLTKLGLNNPATIIWETIPLSFVVDYFVAVGSYLDAFASTHSLKFEHGFYTNAIQGSGLIRPKYLYRDMVNAGMAGSPPGWALTLFTYKRSVYGTWPVPRLTIGTGISSATRASITAALAVVGRTAPVGVARRSNDKLSNKDLYHYDLPNHIPIPGRRSIPISQ